MLLSMKIIQYHPKELEFTDVLETTMELEIAHPEKSIKMAQTIGTDVLEKEDYELVKKESARLAEHIFKELNLIGHTNKRRMLVIHLGDFESTETATIDMESFEMTKTRLAAAMSMMVFRTMMSYVRRYAETFKETAKIANPAPIDDAGVEPILDEKPAKKSAKGQKKVQK